MANALLTEGVLQLNKQKIIQALDKGADINLLIESGNRVNNSRTITHVTPSYPAPGLWHMLLYPELFQLFLDKGADVHFRNPNPLRLNGFTSTGTNILLYFLSQPILDEEMFQTLTLLQSHGVSLDVSVDDQGHNIFDFLASLSNYDMKFYYLSENTDTLLSLFPNLFSFLDERHVPLLEKSIDQKRVFFQRIFELQHQHSVENAKRQIRQVGRNVIGAEYLRSTRLTERPGLPQNTIRIIQQHLSGLAYDNKNIAPTFDNTMTYLHGEHNALEGGKKKRKTRKHKRRRTRQKKA
jgi:hypothetical protein